MIHLLILAVHLLATIAKLARPGGVRAVVAESLLLKQQLLISSSAPRATCHVPPLYTEPGYNMHSPSEIGIDAFRADRSPTHMYRTAPLAGCGHTRTAASTTTEDSPRC